MTWISDGGDNDLPSVLNSYLLETGEHHQYLVSPNILTILPQNPQERETFCPTTFFAQIPYTLFQSCTSSSST